MDFTSVKYQVNSTISYFQSMLKSDTTFQKLVEKAGCVCREVNDSNTHLPHLKVPEVDSNELHSFHEKVSCSIAFQMLTNKHQSTVLLSNIYLLLSISAHQIEIIYFLILYIYKTFLEGIVVNLQSRFPEESLDVIRAGAIFDCNNYSVEENYGHDDIGVIY